MQLHSDLALDFSLGAARQIGCDGLCRVNVRRVFLDNSTNPVTFWVGNNHGASIIKIEPLD